MSCLQFSEAIIGRLPAPDESPVYVDMDKASIECFGHILSDQETMYLLSYFAEEAVMPTNEQIYKLAFFMSEMLSVKEDKTEET